MTIEVTELRRADRFVAVETITGTFGPADMIVLDLSLAGAKISHAQPIRIGTKAKLSFKRGDATATVHAQVIWSHLSPGKGGMAYQSGLKLEDVDPQYALALNTLLRAKVLTKDANSLDKKRERLIARELQRKTLSRTIPTAGGVDS